LVEAVNILLIDDHALFREGLSLILERLDSPLVTLQARTIRDALAYVSHPDEVHLLLMDFYISDADGLQGLVKLRQAFPSSAIVLVSASHDLGLIREAILLGACGFIHKSAAVEAMLAGLSNALAGCDCFIYPEDLHPPRPARHLTPRQREVLAQLCLGKSNKDIGRALLLSENTVRIHLADIFRILGVTSRTGAIVLAKSGLLFDRDELYRQSN
jgi:DNA-binding NarL/FixJ family response regulator